MSQPRSLSSHAAINPIAHASAKPKKAAIQTSPHAEEYDQRVAICLVSCDLLVPTDQEAQRMEPLRRDEVRHDEESNDKDDQERVMKGPKRSGQDKLPDDQEVDNPQWNKQGTGVMSMSNGAARSTAKFTAASAMTIITWTIETRSADIE